MHFIISVLKKLSLLAAVGVICGCTNEFEENVITSEKFVPSSTFKFASKEDFRNSLESTRSSRSLSFPEPYAFTSLLDTIPVSDPMLNSLSQEEREEVLDNHLTYYEALGYEQIIPNENVARFLNHKGEIVVDDTLYRITPLGTYSVPVTYRAELDSIGEFVELNAEKLPMNADSLYLSSHVLWRNTFADVVEKIGTSTLRSNLIRPSRTAVKDIPFNTFPSFTTKSHTIVGKLMGKLFGDRSVKHHEYRKNYRVSGSLYDYDYGFYSEIGTFVEVERKRGGFFKFVNGWKSVQAQELVISYQGIALEINYKMPSLESIIPTNGPVKLQNPFLKENENNPYIAKVNGQFQFISPDPLISIDIFTYHISEDDIIQFAGKSLKEALSSLNQKYGSGISTDARVIRFFTPKKSYMIFWDDCISQGYTKKIRKVFDSNVRFVIGYSSSGFAASIQQMFKTLEAMPVKRLVKGKVLLAGKHENLWGGMTIEKK